MKTIQEKNINNTYMIQILKCQFNDDNKLANNNTESIIQQYSDIYYSFYGIRYK